MAETRKALDAKLQDPVQLVKDSAAYAAKHAKHVKINQTKLEEFAKKLDTKKVKKSRFPLRLPINFDSLNHEINFQMLHAATAIGSAYRHQLHKITGEGAAQTMLYGLVALVLSDKHSKLDAFTLCNIDYLDIEKEFKIPAFVEKPHKDIPVMKVQGDSELKPLADDLKFIFNDCGRILRGRMCEDFGEWVLNTIKDVGSSAVKLVEEIVKTFPAFNDIGKLHDGTPVYFFKKAQLAVTNLYTTFRKRDSRFDFPDIDKLTIFVDNVIPAVLSKEGVLEYDDYLKNIINNKKILQPGPVECELRACAVHACEEIVKIRNKEFFAIDLDYYLWRLGKEEGYLQIERHATPSLFY